MRAFVLAGIKYTYDVNSNSNDRNNQDLIKISPHDFLFEVGGGIQFFSLILFFLLRSSYQQESEMYYSMIKN